MYIIPVIRSPQFSMVQRNIPPVDRQPHLVPEEKFISPSKDLEANLQHILKTFSACYTNASLQKISSWAHKVGKDDSALRSHLSSHRARLPPRTSDVELMIGWNYYSYIYQKTHIQRLRNGRNGIGKMAIAKPTTLPPY